VNRGDSSIDAVTAAARDEALDFAGMSSPDGAVTLLIAEAEGTTEGSVETLTRIVEQHDGQLVKSESGASMCSFASAHGGLHTAIELQRAFASAPLRIGLHSGFVMADASEFFGRNVVLAARIANFAQPGEILVSAALREYTAGDPSFEFEPRGDQHFKGLLGEHPVFAVSWSSGAEG
jgi:class 3 adenylate cyclase